MVLFVFKLVLAKKYSDGIPVFVFGGLYVMFRVVDGV